MFDTLRTASGQILCLPPCATVLLVLMDLKSLRGTVLTLLGPALVAALVTPTPADVRGSILDVFPVSPLMVSPVDTHRKREAYEQAHRRQRKQK